MSAYFAVGLWHHWLVRRDIGVRRAATGRRCGPALDWVVVAAAAVRRHQLDARPSTFCAAGRLARASTSRCAPGSRSPTCSTTRSPSGSSPAAGSATRCASTATCSPTSRPTRWTGTTRCSAARSAGGRRSSCSSRRWDEFVVPGLGIRCVDTNPWVTGAETCELAMALDTLGDHRRALAAARRHAAPARRRRPATGPAGSTARDRRQLAGRAHDVHRGRGDPRRRRAGGDPRAQHRRARASCAAPRWRRTSARSRSSAAAPQPTRSPASPAVRRSTRIEPSASTSSKRAGLERAQEDVVRRLPAVRGVREHVVDDQQRRPASPSAPSRCSRSGRAPRRARRR